MLLMVVEVVVVVDDDVAMHVMDLYFLVLSKLVVDLVNYMMNHHNGILVFDIDDNL
jgi:hypothetical protein